MNQDILQATAPLAAPKPKKKHAVSAMAVVLAIILAIVLILLGERIIFDINKVANPLVEKTDSVSDYSYSGVYQNYASEKSALSPARVYYPQEQKDNYLLYKILLHSAFIIPIFLLTFLFYYLVYLKHENSPYRVLVGGYIAFAFWMILHLIVETGYFVVVKYKNAAVYIILIVLAIIFSALIFFIQKKMAYKTGEV
ncbi:MAG: hypothetical protein WC675_02580 [Patescibacteria group bacterium]|jgi:hypothetical protein